MCLLNVQNGEWVRVLGFAGGQGVEEKLRPLGVFPGERARVVRQAPFGGPVLVEIQGREIALGRGVAAKVMVEALGGVALCD